MNGATLDDATFAPLVGTLQNPWAYIAIVAIGVIVFGIRALIRALVSGALRTDREVGALEKRAETAESAMRIRDEQVDRALRVLPQIAEVLEKFHVAGEQVRQERAIEGDEP